MTICNVSHFFLLGDFFHNSLDIMQYPDGDDESEESEEEDTMDEDEGEPNARNLNRKGGMRKD